MPEGYKIYSKEFDKTNNGLPEEFTNQIVWTLCSPLRPTTLVWNMTLTTTHRAGGSILTTFLKYSRNVSEW